MKKQDDGQFPERWIRAFLQGVKVSEICQAAGFSRSKYYQLRADPAFQAVLTERRDAMIEASVDALRESFFSNIRILREIAENPENAPQVRINSIAVMLGQLKDWIPLVDLQARLERLEQAKDDGNNMISGGAA